MSTHAAVSTLVGTGVPGHGSDGAIGPNTAVAEPFGVVLDPAGALVFCDLGNHRVCRIDLRSRALRTIVGTGSAGHSGDDGPARDAELPPAFPRTLRGPSTPPPSQSPQLLCHRRSRPLPSPHQHRRNCLPRRPPNLMRTHILLRSHRHYPPYSFVLVLSPKSPKASHVVTAPWSSPTSSKPIPNVQPRQIPQYVVSRLTPKCQIN